MGLILKVIKEEERFLTMQEVYAGVKHKDDCTYGAIRKSLEVLDKAGMVTREPVPGTNLKEVRPTQKGYDWFRPLRD